MKIQSLLLYAFFVSTAIFSGCSKPYEQALPTVQFVSAVPYGLADSVLVTGNVTSQGGSFVEYTGFCFSNIPSFDILSRQVLLNGSSGQFSAIVPASNDSTYYFKCFAANQYGYSLSSVFKYTVPSAIPDSAPCSIPQNTVIFNGSNWTPYTITASGASPPFGSYYVEIDFGLSYTIDAYFNKVPPTNGIYTVFSTMDFSRYNQYAATLTMNGTPFNEGGYVYIAQNKNGSTTLSFCSLTVNLFSQNYPTTLKVTF